MQEQREGVICEGRGGLYTVADDGGAQFVLRARNRFRFEGVTPLVGDRVRFTPGKDDQHGWLDELLPRTSEITRPPVANVTQLVITLAPEPAPDYLLADKLLVSAYMQGIAPLIAVNKTDLSPGMADAVGEAYAKSGAPVLAVSAKSGEGLPVLRDAMQGHLSCLAGQSGTGKSTLISRLTGRDLKTGEISPKIQRGRQTTRHVTLLTDMGLRVLDTAGFSLLELPLGMEPEQLREYYPEFAPYSGNCRFTVCLHGAEPGCAVEEAARAGEISRDRVDRYRLLLQDVKETWGNRYG
ncbi:MAG TPA: ribosome small subunit-dependent GTPase A [Candidatus Limnocylindria bacterium]|nr:ribosome small subunit-dependent GTPase A [Candidatus Limnocylindria bacterium]